LNLSRHQKFIQRAKLLEITDTTANTNAQTGLRLKKNGKPIPEKDIWIAAVCIENKSFLMNLQTFLAHRRLWGEEEGSFLKDLSNLTEQENEMFTALKENRYGPGLRLEQERIAYSFLLKEIRGHCQC
jgi:hypothetical protein